MAVHLDYQGPVAILVLDRPPVNALDTATWNDLANRLEQVATSSARSLVLAAAGDRAFSAGADIKEFGDFLVPGKGLQMARHIHGVQDRLEDLPIPTIAAIDAPALGGGCELVLACDLRVAGSTATFGFPEVTVGQFPGTGGTMRLPWLIGESRAREVLLTGRAIGAAMATEIGLVHRVVDAGTALTAAIEWATELSSLPAAGLAAVKRSLLRGRSADRAERVSIDSDLSEEVFQSPEAVEGYRAFIEKRKPNYSTTAKQEPS